MEYWEKVRPILGLTKEEFFKSAMAIGASASITEAAKFVSPVQIDMEG